MFRNSSYTKRTKMLAGNFVHVGISQYVLHHALCEMKHILLFILMKNSNVINLDVMFVVSPVPANINKVSEDITVNEGSNVTLSCLASGRPEPVITWRLLNPLGKNHPISTHYHVRQSSAVLKSFIIQRPGYFFM